MKGSGCGSGASDKQKLDPPNQIFTYLNVINPQYNFKKPGSHDTVNVNSFYNSIYDTSGNEHANFLYTYFCFAYYLLLSPFRFRKVGPGRFEIHKWIPQQVICAIAQVLCLLRIATTLRLSLKGIETNDPVSYFLLFSEIFSFAFKGTLLFNFWRKQKKYQRLIMFLNNPHIFPYSPYKMESMPTVIGLCSLYTLFSFLRLYLGSGELNFAEMTPICIYRRLVGDARYTFFLEEATNTTTTSITPFEEITFFDTVIAIIQILSIQIRSIGGFYVDLCIFIHVVTLWAPTSGFAQSLYSQNPVVNDKMEIPFDLGSSVKVELNSVIKQFDTLKNLSILIGETVGDAIVPYIGEALLYYAIYLDYLLLKDDYVTRLVLLFFYTSAICILSLGAEIVRKLRWLKFWLSDVNRLALIDQNQFAMMLDDMAHNHVGITASGVFTINYNLVGTVVGVLITYFIIRLQTTPGSE